MLKLVEVDRHATVKRLCDLGLASIGLVLGAPLLAAAAAGIRLSSPGPLLYRAPRIGRAGRPFTMYKLRTMLVGDTGATSAITGRNDPRVFRFGAWLRRAKIDELPQLFNVLRGDMSLVGPRPEDPRIVAEHFTPRHFETLVVRPGLASPGSIYNYTHGERLLTGADPERDYVEQLLPFKLALEVVYVRRASLRYDVAIIGRALATIAAVLLGRRRFPDPPEAPEARQLMAQAGATCAHSTPAIAPNEPAPRRY